MDILRFLQFELARGFLFFEESFEFWDGFEQAGPLFIIECDGEAPEAIDADAAFSPTRKSRVPLRFEPDCFCSCASCALSSS